MESPPSSSTWSEAFILSDDSGLLLTNESATSSSMNDDSKNGKKYFAFEVSTVKLSLHGGIRCRAVFISVTKSWYPARYPIHVTK